MPKKRMVALGGIGVIVILFLAFVTSASSQNDGKLRIYFCDVGQGDAAYIRFPDGEDMVIDGGPNKKILDCLGRYMPFYDREIDVVVLSHPQKDHMQGLIDVLDRYSVSFVVIGAEGNESLGYTQLVDVIRRRNIPLKQLYRGDEISMGEARIRVLWPTRQFVAANVPIDQCGNATMKCSILENGAVLGLSTDEELNNFSYYMHLRYGEFDALFTGDGDSKIQPKIEALGGIPDVEVLKFPHHGSKKGISGEFLDLIGPELAVISVGKNSYGHPTKEALEILRNKDIRILRTDRDGDVVVESDGRRWEVN